MSSTSIKFKRGNKADLPQSAPSGTPLWCEDSHELYMGTGNGVTKASKNDVVNDTTNQLSLMGVPANDLAALKCDSQITMQGGILRALQFIGNLIGNATCDGDGNNIVDTYARKQSVQDISDSLPNYQLKSEKGKKNGYAPLNASSIVSYDYLPDDIANKSLSNLNTAGEDKLNTSKMYMTGQTSSDPTGYAQLLAMKQTATAIIDKRISENFTIYGNPTITNGLADFSSQGGYAHTGFTLPEEQCEFTIHAEFIANDNYSDGSSQYLMGSYGGYDNLYLQADYNKTFILYNFIKNPSGTASYNAMLQTKALDFSAGDVVSFDFGFNYEKGFFIQVSANGVTQESSDDRYMEFWYNKPLDPIIIGTSSNYYLSSVPFKRGIIDLNEFRIRINGKLSYIACLHIPCLLTSTNSKIVVDEKYTHRVDLLYEYNGQAPYFTINETNQTFTLPKGEIYGMLERKANIEHLPIKPLCQLISSAIPIRDKNLHLLDGSIITASSVHSDFVQAIKDYYDSGYEVLYGWGASDMGEMSYIYTKTTTVTEGMTLYKADGTVYTGSDWHVQNYGSGLKIYLSDWIGTETPAVQNSTYNKNLPKPADIFTTESNWQSLNSANGECVKFVYDSSANTVRLPNINPYNCTKNGLAEFKYIVVSQLL